MKTRVIILLAFLFSSSAIAQFTDRYWAFGDSSAIDFRNLSNPVSNESILRSRGTCASICDSNGTLLFYASDPDIDLWMQPGNLYLGYIVNRNHERMEGGDTIAAEGWYQEMIIVPDPSNYNRFYLFHAGITTSYPGFYYSIIDLSYNGGLGKVVQKNIQLHTFPVSDGLAAVKHGNGRDWWILFKPYDVNGPTDEIYEYLLTEQGLSGPFVKHVGTGTITNLVRLEFSKQGDRLALFDSNYNFQLFFFDRCTGTIGNTVDVNLSPGGPFFAVWWSCVFSPDASKMYTTIISDGPGDSISYLVQYDLNAGNIFNSADTLHTFYKPSVAGFLQRGPDDKIYLSSYLDINDCEFFYLYCDTSYYPENMNISVINQPNNLGAACDFQPFSFYLGGHRAYLGLPNNPDYELGPDTTSLCDTITNRIPVIPGQSASPELHVFYHSSWEKVFLNAFPVRGKNYDLKLLDISGRLVYSEQGATDLPYFSKTLDTHLLKKGIYVVVVETERERMVGRFVY